MPILPIVLDTHSGKQNAMRSFIFAACLSLSIVFFPSLTYAQTPPNNGSISIKGTIKDDFARIVFYGNRLGRFSVRFRGDTVIAELGRTATPRYGGLLSTLQGYVSNISTNSDGTRITFQLRNRNVRIRKFSGRGYAGFDLVGKPQSITTTATAEQAPRPTTQTATSQPTSQTAAAPATTPAPQTTTPTVESTTISIPRRSGPGLFTGAFPLPRFKPLSILPTPLQEIAKKEEQTAETPPTPEQTTSEQAVSPAESSETATPTQKTQESATKLTETTAKTTEEDNTPLEPNTVETKTTESEAAEEEPGEAEKTTSPERNISATPNGPTAAEIAARALGKVQAAEDKAAQEAAAKKALEEAAKAEVEALTANTSEKEPEEAVFIPENKLLLRAKTTEDKKLRIVFPWQERIAAASYTRGGHLWVIFDKPALAVTETLKELEQELIENPQQVMHRHYTVMRFKLSQPKVPYDIAITKEDFEWILTIGRGKDTPVDFAINPILEVVDGSAQLFMRVLNTAEPLYLNDPIVGDKVVVVPNYAASVGVTPTRTFVDFKLLETHQGAAITLFSDIAQPKILRDGIRLASPQGLNLFNDKDKTRFQSASAQEEKKLVVQQHSVLPFQRPEFAALEEGWDAFESALKHGHKPEEKNDTYTDEAEGEEEAEEDEHADEEGDEHKDEETQDSSVTDEAPQIDIYEAQRVLIDAVRTAKNAEDASEKRLLMADFYFSEGLYAEALGALNYAAVEDLEVQNTKHFKFLKGATHLLLGHFAKAEALFTELEKTLADDEGVEEAHLLRWASHHQMPPSAKSDGEKTTLRFYDNFQYFLRDYPSAIRHKLGLLAAEKWLDEDNVKKARAILSFLGEEEATPFQKNWERYLVALVDEQENRPEDALAIYEQLEQEVEDRRVRAHAAFAKVQLLIKQRQITLKQAIKATEDLRIVWRGDNFERNLLRFIGRLYIKNNQYMEGLRAWRELATEFPRTQDALVIAGRMRQTFIDLFEKGKAFDIPPFEALSIYFEFRELTPVGALGDKITRNLADIFVNADLLESATALLQHQTRFRSEGEEKYQLALKLASIYIDNNQPEKALEALEFIDLDDASEEIALKHKYTTAQALINQAKYTDTFLLLADDDSRAAEDFRLEMFWRLQNWFAVIDITEPRLAETRQNPFPLTDEEMASLVKLSIAYANQEDRENLNALRQDFSFKIPDDNKRSVFLFVTNNKGMVDHRRLEETVQLTDIGVFMNRHFFWPNKQWESVITVLAPKVANISTAGRDRLEAEERYRVLQLAVAYAMTGEREDQLALRALQRDFSNFVAIDRTNMPPFEQLGEKGKPFPKAAFDPPTPLRNIEEFIERHQEQFMIEEKEEPQENAAL